MLDFILLPENTIFTAALLLMLLLGIVEAVGFGSAAFDAGIGFDNELSIEGSGTSPAWIDLSGVPLLVILVVALAAFATAGFAVQHAAIAWSGGPLPLWLASAAAAGAALPTTLVTGRAAARWLPRDETAALPLDSLLGRRGHIQTGVAASGSPARARVRDAFGQSHYPLVEPHHPDRRLHEGVEMLLVRRNGDLFYAVEVDPDPFLKVGDLP